MSTELDQIISRAIALLERPAVGSQRQANRQSIATTIRWAGLANTFSAFLTEVDTNFAGDPGREPIVNAAIGAKAELLAGNWQKAEEILLSVDDQRMEQERGHWSACFTLLDWLIERSRIDDAERFFNSVDWGGPGARIGPAQRLAQHFADAGDMDRGVDLLLGLKPAPDATDTLATIQLSRLGQAIWMIDAVDLGRDFIRRAADFAIRAVRRDPNLPLHGQYRGEPLTIAQIQCAVGDRDSASETLQAVLELAVPLEYELATLVTIHLRPKLGSESEVVRIGERQVLTPASRKWQSCLPDLARALARADRDTEAFSLVDADNPSYLTHLLNIVNGQAKRGAFEEAFKTIDKMREAAALTVEKADRTLSDNRKYFGTIQSPFGPSQGRELRAARQDTEALICGAVNTTQRAAARAGNETVFARCDDLLKSPDWKQRASVNDLRVELYVHGGKVDAALDYACHEQDVFRRSFAISRALHAAVIHYGRRRSDPSSFYL